MRQLVQRYLEDSRVQSLYGAYLADSGVILGSCQGSFASVLLAALCQRLEDQKPALIVCAEADDLHDDLEELGVQVAVLRAIDDWNLESEDERDRQAFAQRLSALQSYLHGATLIATPQSLKQDVPDLQSLSSSNIVLRSGDTYDLHELAETLIENKYQLCHVVEKRGDVAVRGGLLDVYPWVGEHALRIEFFGDEVDTIRKFDIFTQESIGSTKEAQLLCNSDAVANKSIWSQIGDKPFISFGDIPLDQRINVKIKHTEIRFARQLERDAIDGASVGIERYKGDALRDFDELKSADVEQTCIVFARNEEAVTDMRQLLAETEVDDVRRGRLSAGFRDLDQNICVLHDFELQERKATKRRKLKQLPNAAPLSSLSDLRDGNYVVHLKHGIGRFKGMATLEKNGYFEDHLLLLFADEAKLYVPISGIDLVQKYIGGSGRHPELSRLGGNAWAKKRAKAEKAIEDLTATLLEAHAKRLSMGGISFAKDTAESVRFDVRFPFEETADQLAAIREIKADMEREQFMDRLLCGDVGFGKTEVAMRAAYKAVQSGYQVAVLAPTTLLTEQHALSFTNRFDDEGVEIACINRFRNTAERREILELTESGKIDILIGTHALLNKALSFKKLGLLIVDEEQRFGVKQKEILRDLRVGVDVLTMTATPIPRTLHFSLLGLRDISVLAEAPSERLAVETKVSIWDDQLIKHAIEREKERDGQVFFIHNRVQDIDNIAFKLSRLMPDLRIEVIHGQMHEQRISNVMSAYKRGDIDCLVATSIVESGIDIPNANTLFVNNAHYFGLAELHQIRGRIGRFTRQAYAYFMTPKRGGLNKEAQERMDAIQEYAELGAGFKLAMRDLELRGAGNLLGAEQSGQIDAIGYELYCKLLAEAVAKQGGPVADNHLSPSEHVVLSFGADAYIPDDYVDNPALKFDVHKSIDSCTRISDLEAIWKSLRDRFGPAPIQLSRLIKLKAIRIRCNEHNISKIQVQDRHIRLHIGHEIPPLDAREIPEVVHIQADDGLVTLFMKERFEQDELMRILGSLMKIDIANFNT